MEVIFHSSFKKQYGKLKPAERQKFEAQLHLFMKNSHNSVLRNHALKGRYAGYYSINVTGDLRALYKLVKKDTALFMIIDTHSNLYG